jgi:hypothetical protein
MNASIFGYFEILKLFIENNADISIQDEVFFLLIKFFFIIILKNYKIIFIINFFYYLFMIFLLYKIFILKAKNFNQFKNYKIFTDVEQYNNVFFYLYFLKKMQIFLHLFIILL